MPWTDKDVDWVAARLLGDLHDIYRRSRYIHTTRRLEKLHRELSAFMKIRITEPVFFLGKNRRVDDVLDHVEVGPYRTTVIPGGLARIPQFVEMPDEIKEIIQDAVASAPATPVPPAPSPVVDPPVAAVPAPKPATVITPQISKFTELADRIKRVHGHANDRADALNKRLDVAEPKIDTAFDSSEQRLDKLTMGVTQIEDVVRDMAGANGDPL